MLMALRLFEAKRLLAAGEAPAQVAAAVGLTDQAHLTRAFARRYGVTPARYQQQLGTRPPRKPLSDTRRPHVRPHPCSPEPSSPWPPA